MYKLATGAASLVRPLPLQGGEAIPPQTAQRSKGLTKLSLVMLQSAIILTGILMVTPRASASSQYCLYDANPTFPPGSPYSLGLYYNPNRAPWVSPQYGCTTYYSGSNYVMTWNITSHGYDFLPGAGHFQWGVGVNSAKTNAQAYHHHSLSTNSGRAYFMLYGKMASGTEWYIVEDWSGGPQPWDGWTAQATSVPINGVNYDIYQRIITNPDTKQQYQQWWSVRKGTSTAEWVPYVQHFLKWETITNGPLGRLASNEVIETTNFTVEVNEPGSGTLNINSMDETSYPPK